MGRFKPSRNSSLSVSMYMKTVAKDITSWHCSKGEEKLKDSEFWIEPGRVLSNLIPLSRTGKNMINVRWGGSMSIHFFEILSASQTMVKPTKCFPIFLL